MATLFRMWLVAASLLLALPGFSQDLAERATIRTSSTQAKDSSGSTYAVIVGVSSYKNLPSLMYASDDAVAFNNFLRSSAGGSVPAKNILLIRDTAAKTGVLKTACLQWLNEKKISKGDRIYFYLAGHGDAYRETYYFFTSDAVITTGPRNYDIEGNIDLNVLQKRLQEFVKYEGAEVFLIIDACRINATDLNDSTTRMAMRLSDVSKSQTYLKGFYSFFSTKDGSVALESHLIGGGHGIFTYYLIKGAVGDADAVISGNQDGSITLLELGTYLKTVVPRVSGEILSRKQLPQYCCQEEDEKLLFTVDKALAAHSSSDDNLLQLLRRNDTAHVSFAATRNPNIRDRALISLQTRFIEAVKKRNLIEGDNSALGLYYQLRRQWPQDEVTLEAKLLLISELINYPKDVVHLYLLGLDTKRIKSKASANDNSLDAQQFEYYERVSVANFIIAAQHLKIAIELLGRSNPLAEDLYPVLWFLQARSYLDGNRELTLPGAIQLAEKALRVDSGAVHVYHLLAILNIKQGNYYLAEQSFIRALEGESQYSKAAVELGYELFRLKLFDEASVYYRLRSITAEEYAIGYNTIALALLDSKSYDDAEYYFFKGLTTDPGAQYIRNNLATMYHELALNARVNKRNLESEYYFKAATEQKPKALNILINFGNFYTETKQHSRAREMYLKAQTYAPKDLLLLTNLATLYYNAQHYDSAVYYSNLIIKYSKPNTTYYQNAQVRIRNSKKLEERYQSKTPLQDLFESSLTIDEAAPTRVIAQKYLEIHEFVKARQVIKGHLSQAPGDLPLILLLADTYIGMKDHSSALKVLQTLENHNNEKYIEDLAKRYVALGEHNKAIKLLRQAIYTDSYDANYSLLLGRIYEQEEKSAEAEATYLASYYRSPENKEILTALYQLYARQGRSKQAERYLVELNKLR